MKANRYFPIWTIILAIMLAIIVFSKGNARAYMLEPFYYWVETTNQWSGDYGYQNIKDKVSVATISANKLTISTTSPYTQTDTNDTQTWQNYTVHYGACLNGTLYGGGQVLQTTLAGQSAPGMTANVDFYEIDHHPTNADCQNPPPVDCTEDYLAKAEDCGGEAFIQNWDDQTCEGNCYCEETPTDDLGTNTYKQISDFCGGPSRVEAYYSEICMGECKGCDSEYAQAVADCAAEGWSVDRNSPRADECIYECAVEPCLDEFLQKEEDCGFWGIDPSSKNYDNCTASCAQACDDQYDALKTKCGIAGVAWFDNDTCSGGCKDCEWSRDECDSSCVSGFGKTDCSQRSSEGNIVSVNYGKCECLSPSEVMNTPEGGEGETYDGKEFFNGTPGSHGGTVVKNPDGSYTETLGNGVTYTYSADGKTVTASDGNGKTLSVSKNGNTTTYMGTNEFGEFTRITLEANPDGTITKKTEQGNDINFESPELGPNLIVTDSEEETVEGETTTAIDGTVINNPTYNEETEQPESTGPEITAQYQSSESYKWTDRVNYTAWNAAKADWNTKSPSAIFNRTIEPYLQTFIKPGEVPQWSIAFPSVGVLPAFDIDIDLSPFNQVVPWFRFFIALGLVFVTFRNVPKLWSGES